MLSILLCSVAVASMPLSAAGATRAARSTASLPNIEPQVMCVTCKIPLNTAESPQASKERGFIRELIDEGRDEAQIKKALVAQYGPAVLSLPSAKGFDLTVYVVPAAVIVALLALLAVLLPRWKRTTRETAGAPPTAASIDPADAERLRRDMARFD